MYRVLILAVLILTAAAGGAYCQAPAPSPTPAPAPAPPETASYTQRGVLETDYRIRPGDVLSVNVMTMADLAATPVVQPDGNISLPLLKVVKASGLTMQELGESLTVKFGEYIKNPVVAVDITTFHTPTVWVLGQVKAPGTVRAQPGFGLRDYLASAGGLTETADLSRVTLSHPGGASVEVDLSTRGDASKIPSVAEDDVIIVAELKGNVSALGKVEKPGTFEFRRGMRVSDVLTLAGGGLEDADLYAVQVINNGKALQTVNISAFFEKADETQNPEIFPGDVVYVPESNRKAYVYGAVAKSGVYRIKPEERVVDMIMRAGGMTGDAQPSKVSVVRLVENQPKPTEFDITNYMRKGDLTNNPLVEAADIIYVPEKGKPSTWSSVTQPLMALTTLFNLLR